MSGTSLREARSVTLPLTPTCVMRRALTRRPSSPPPPLLPPSPPLPILTPTPTRTRTSTLTQVVLDPHSGHESFVPFCACAPVAMPTPFSSASTCLEHWASDPSSACQRPKASDPTTTRTAPVPSTTASEAQLEHFEKVLAAADSP